MGIRAKTRRRLVTLVAITAVIGVLLSAFVLMRRASNARELAERRQTGMQLAQEGQYVDALPHLRRVLIERPEQANDDPDLLYWFAQAQRAVPAADGSRQHLAQASRALRRVLELQPTNIEARDQLLELYIDLRQSSETLRLAETILAEEPEHARALHARGLSLVWLGRFNEAATALEQLVELHPENMMAPFVLAQTYARMQRTPQQIVAWAAALEGQHPDDPRYDLLLAYAYRMAQDQNAARAALQPVVDWTPQDPEAVTLLTRQLVAAGMLDEALAALRRADEAAHDPQIRRQYVQRLWEIGEHARVVELLGDLDGASPLTAPALLGFKAMALHALGQTEAGNAVASDLDKRNRDPQARSWSLALRAASALDAGQTQQVLDLGREAANLDSANVLAWWILAQAYAGLGERELAVEQLQHAAEAAPLWPMPHIQMARLLAESGRVAEAVQTAQWARTLAPRSMQAAVALASAWAAAIDAGVNNQVDSLLMLTHEVLAQGSIQPDILRIHASLLLRAGRADEARAAIESALASDQALPETTWLALAAISDRGAMGLGAACLARAEKAAGLTPELALRQAMAAREQAGEEAGDAAGLRRIDEVLAQAPENDRLPWEAVRARYLEQISSPQALEAWRAIAQRYPDDLRAIQWVLDAQSAWQDRPLIDRTIDRMRAQTGDTARGWRVHRARWLVAAQGGEEQYLQALSLLDNVLASSPGLVEPRLLAAVCHERLGNFTQAIEQLSTAINLRPTLAAPRLDYARLLLAQGQNVLATAQLDEVMSRPDLDAALRRQGAALLAQGGRVQRAIALLEQMIADDPADQQSLLLLANLYRRADEPQKTEAICQRLLADPTGPGVEFAADFHASRGHMDQAEAALALLDGLDLPPGTAQLVRANFAVRHQTVDQAMNQLHEATRVAPQSTHAWHGLLALAAKIGRGGEAVAAIEDGLKAMPDDPWLTRLRPHIDLIRRFADQENARPVLVALVEDPSRTNEAIETLGVLDELRTSADARTPEGQERVLTRLRSLAGRYPRFLAVQTVVVRELLTAGRAAEAAALAQRAMQAFPSAVEPAWMAAEALAAAGQWTEALGVAQEWRRRSSNRPLAADLMIAEAEIQLNEAERAAHRMQQYVDRAMANPEAYAPVLIRQARALIAAGAEQKAAELLTPLLRIDRGWRDVWVRLAVLAIENPAASARWLEEAQATIPADDPEGHAIIARAWYTLGQRSGDDMYRNRGRDMLVAQANHPQATLANLFNLALVYEVEDRLDDAERWYRKALAAHPDSTPAMNNLAMVKIKQGRDLDEAVRMAREALRHQGEFGPYLDTLAMAYSTMGEHDKAVETMRRAVAVDPTSAEWRARLAKELAATGERDEARRIAAQLLESDPELLRLPEDLREAVRALGASMSAAAETAF